MSRYYYKFNYQYSKPADTFIRTKKVQCVGDEAVLREKYRQILKDAEESKTMFLKSKECVKQETGWLLINNNFFGDDPPSPLADWRYAKPIQKFCKLCDEECGLKCQCPCNGNKNWKKDTMENMKLVLGIDDDFTLINKKTNQIIM